MPATEVRAGARLSRRQCRLHSAAMRKALLVLALAALVLAGCGGGKKTQADFVKANANLAGKIPLYPNAKLTKQTSVGYTAGQANVVGYQTRFIYSLPAGANLGKVEGFYLHNLQSWKQVASLLGPVLNYRKGNSFVSINLSEVKQLHMVEVVVDDSFYSHVPKPAG